MVNTNELSLGTLIKIDFILAEWHFMSDVYTFVVNEHIEFVWLLTCGLKYIIFSFIMTKVVGMPHVCKATFFGFKLSFVFSFLFFFWQNFFLTNSNSLGDSLQLRLCLVSLQKNVLYPNFQRLRMNFERKFVCLSVFNSTL